MDKKEFIFEAILDTQETIRAIDVKIGALLAALLIPFSSLGSIWTYFTIVYSNYPKVIGIVLPVIFGLSWILSIISLIRALSAIDNPANHIINSAQYKGSFYGGGLYQFGVLDSLINRDIIKASKDVATIVADAPNTPDEIINELAFEQLKLIYIREVKLFRLKMTIKFSSIWLSTGVFSYCLSKFI
jgi:hypothetical protein